MNALSVLQTLLVLVLAFILSAGFLTRPLLSFLRRGAPVWAVLLFHAVVAVCTALLWMTSKYPSTFA